MVMKPEYREGPEATERFESLARAILQAQKPKIKPRRQQPKTATSRKPKSSDKD
jgi:hypothetical protein